MNNMKYLLLTMFVAASLMTTATISLSACATDTRPIGQQIDDKKNENILQRKLSDKNVFNGCNITVNIYYGTVLLTGQIKTPNQKDEAEDMAKTTIGINKIYNYLAVGNSLTLASVSNDTMITTKVITKLVNTPKVDSNKIKIVTSNKVVYVMGMISHKDAEQISKIVADIPDVSKVVILFSYLD
jgi:osmotically-inducible protein OsmY